MTTEFKSHSQAGQDKFVWEVTNHQTNGTFFDIGCGHPIEINNTYALEQVGWNGLLVDNGEILEQIQQHRTSKFLNADATTVDWDAAWPKGVVNYLSLDCNGSTMPTLRRIPFDRFRFVVITVEHDKYRFGDAIQKEMREILGKAGYELVFSDVLCMGNPFEDWWVKSGYVDMDLVKPFRQHHKEWSEVVK